MFLAYWNHSMHLSSIRPLVHKPIGHTIGHTAAMRHDVVFALVLAAVQASCTSVYVEVGPDVHPDLATRMRQLLTQANGTLTTVAPSSAALLLPRCSPTARWAGPIHCCPRAVDRRDTPSLPHTTRPHHRLASP